jgi:hypothetical protein
MRDGNRAVAAKNLAVVPLVSTALGKGGEAATRATDLAGGWRFGVADIDVNAPGTADPGGSPDTREDSPALAYGPVPQGRGRC